MARHLPGLFRSREQSPETDRATGSWQRKPELTRALQLLVFPWAGGTSLLGNASRPDPTATRVTHSALLSDRVTLRNEPNKSLRAYCKIKKMSKKGQGKESSAHDMNVWHHLCSSNSVKMIPRTNLDNNTLPYYTQSWNTRLKHTSKTSDQIQQHTLLKITIIYWHCWFHKESM